MNKAFIWFIVFSIFFSPVNLFADTEVNRIISSWQEQYNKLSSYTADYTQSLYQEGAIKGTTSGVVFFKKPHLFRWEVTSPEPQIIIGDGEFVWVYIPSYKQVIKKNYSSQESFGPFWFTSTEPIDKVKKNFIIKRPFAVNSKDGKIEVLEFLPKKEIADINQVKLWLEPKYFLPLRIDVFLNDDSLNRFVYRNIKMDISIPDELFKIKFPEGTEIFEE